MGGKVGRSGRRLPKEVIDKIRKMESQGYFQREISAWLGVSRSAVRTHCVGKGRVGRQSNKGLRRKHGIVDTADSPGDEHSVTFNPRKGTKKWD